MTTVLGSAGLLVGACVRKDGRKFPEKAYWSNNIWVKKSRHTFYVIAVAGAQGS